MPKKILLQTTIPAIADDWNIARFHLLAEFLDRQRAADGSRLFQVTARNRDTRSGPDSLLSRIDQSDVDQMWLFAVDTGDGLSPEDCAAIAASGGAAAACWSPAITWTWAARSVPSATSDWRIISFQESGARPVPPLH